MGFAKYQIQFLNPADDSIIMFMVQSQPYRLKYEQVLNGVGALTLELPHVGTDYFSMLPLDTLIMIQRILDGSVTVTNDAFYLLRSITRLRVEGDERWVIGGLSLNHLLSRRIIVPEDDPINSGGYVTRNGAADDVITAYVQYQCTSAVQVNAIRAIPDLTVAVSGSIGNSIGRRLRYENLLKEIRDMAKVGYVDFEITRTLDGTGAMVFSCGRIGEDKSVEGNGVLGPYTVLTPDRGNLQSPQYMIDRSKESTIAYTLGEGESTNRPVYVLSSGRENDSIYNRIENLVEVRTNQTGSVTEILTQGQQSLIEHKPQRELKFEIIPDSSGARYRQDLDLGDIVTAKWDSIERTVRIQKIAVSIGDDGEEIKFEVNEEDVN